jgi:DNA modification methylase
MATSKKRLGTISEPLQPLAIDIDELHPDPANARKHNVKNIDAIKASLHAYGQRKPVVVQRQGMIVRAGNGTLEAAKALGWTHLAAVVIDEDNATASQFAIADNRTGELAEWDTETLATLIDGMDDETRELLAFDEKDMQAMLDGLQPEQIETTEDEPPPLPENPTTKAGGIITMGDHRLMCGDCRKPEDMAALMMGATINVAFTSPPYASQRKYDESSGFKPIHPDEFVEWFDAVQSGVRDCLAGDGSWFVNIKEHCEDGQRSLYVKDLTIAHVRQWGWRFVDEYVWMHGGTPMDVQRRFKNGFEPVLAFSMVHDFKFRPKSVMHESDSVPGVYAEKKRDRIDTAESQGNTGDIFANPDVTSGMAYPSTALRLGKNRESLGHGAAFPVALPSFFIKAYSDEGDSIFDPFMGSGTTLIAAEQLGRKCYGMEISPAYCDVIVKRWENLTGKQATRG